MSTSGNEPGLVQAGVLFPTLHYADSIGVDTSRLLTRARLPSDLRDTPSQFLPASSWPRLFDEFHKETGFRDVGWQAASADPLRFYPLQFNEFSTAPTLLMGLRHVCRANRFFSNNQHIWLRFTRDYAYCCHFDEDRGPGYAQRTAFRTGIGLQIIRAFLGPNWYPRLILTETPLDALPDREQLAGAKIVRARGFGALQIPRPLLAASSRRRLDYGYEAGSGRAASLPAEIRCILRGFAADSMPTSQTLAESLKISERTLQRRLGERGTSYSAILQATKFEAARRLLSDPDSRIIDIAIELGFDDQSHFTLYFRNLSGVTPREYRKLTLKHALPVH